MLCLLHSLEEFVLEDGPCGNFSQQLIAEGEASVFDLPSSFFAQSCLEG